VERISQADAAGALGLLDRCLDSGHTLDRFCESLIEQFRRLMLLRVCGLDTELADVPAQERPRCQQLADRFDEPTYVYMISLLEELRRSVRYSGSGRALADAALVRLTQSSRFSSIESLLGAAEAAPPLAAPAPSADSAKKKIADPLPPPAAPLPDRTPMKRPVRTSAERGTLVRPPAPQASAGPAEKANQEECRRALADPIVRRAMELFDASLVSVERAPGGEAPRPETQS